MTVVRQSVLIVTESYWPILDGGAIFEHRLAHALRTAGWRVYVWAPSPTGKFHVENDLGVLTIRESSRILRTNPRYRISNHPFTNSAAVFRLAKPQIVHIHNFGPLGLEALRYAKAHRLPVVVTNHNLPENWTVNFFRRSIPIMDMMLAACFSRLLNLADVVVSPSSTAQRYLASNGVTANSVVISNGVDTRYFCPSTHSLENSPHERLLRLVHVGRLDREKCCDLLMLAISSASLQRPLTLTVVGDGIQRDKLERQVWELEAAGQSQPGCIRFVGTVSESSKLTILQSADLFVTASPAELQGIAVMEAMACGVAALVPDAGALPELCRPGRTGLLFRAGQADDCTRQLCNLDQGMLRTLGMDARTFISNTHDAQITYENYDALLTQTCLSRQASQYELCLFLGYLSAPPGWSGSLSSLER
jgi:1,2-diacylglycerol 3-alpha-glucosyltransferase